MLDINFYSGKKPHSFVLKDKEFLVDTWADMAIKLFDELYEINPSIFETLAVKNFKNPKNPLISKNDYDILNRSKKLTKADIYIEMHHSTASFLRFMLQVLEQYNLVNEFKIKEIV